VEDADAAAQPLVTSIREEIAAHGPITFARFMQRALYDARDGYYTRSAVRPTRAGDFVTAPELHPIFGQTLARQLDEMWRRLGQPDSFVVREYGAGSGSLILALIDGLARLGSPLAVTLRYEPVDFARQRTLISERMTSAGREGLLVPIAERGSLRVGVVVANEYVDALPVHRVVVIDGQLREIHIDWRDDAFHEVAGPLSDTRIADWFSDSEIELAEGQRAEVNLAMLDWIGEVASELERGYVMVIDYGSTARELYGPSRPDGTLRAFAAHRVSSDVLSGVGQRDITAHVDFDALERAAQLSGLDFLGRRRAAEFLLATGLEDAYAQARPEAEQDWDSALGLRSAVQRLIDPNALGGYQVALFSRGVAVEPALRGLAPIADART
jgi:SAM-dependent MidA family methyltransferase